MKRFLYSLASMTIFNQTYTILNDAMYLFSPYPQNKLTLDGMQNKKNERYCMYNITRWPINRRTNVYIGGFQVNLWLSRVSLSYWPKPKML